MAAHVGDAGTQRCEFRECYSGMHVFYPPYRKGNELDAAEDEDSEYSHDPDRFYPKPLERPSSLITRAEVTVP